MRAVYSRIDVRSTSLHESCIAMALHPVAASVSEFRRYIIRFIRVSLLLHSCVSSFDRHMLAATGEPAPQTLR